MEGVFLNFASIIEKEIVQPSNLFLNSFPEKYKILFNLVLYILLIVIYSLLAFEFYDILSRKNILNLNKYNTFTNPFLKILFTVLIFVVEYVILLPLLVFFFFFILSFLLLLLSNQSLQQILITSAVILGAVRITAYFKEELSKDLAKIFLFTVLIIFLLKSDFPDFSSSLMRLTILPSFLQYVPFYFVFLACIEILMRLFYLLDFLFKKLEKPRIGEIKIEEQPIGKLAEEIEYPKLPRTSEKGPSKRFAEEIEYPKLPRTSEKGPVKAFTREIEGPIKIPRRVRETKKLIKSVKSKKR